MWLDKTSNPDLFSTCGVGGSEGLLMQSQLRWAGHVIRTSDDRIPKILKFSQLSYGKRNAGRPRLCYRDELKYNLKATEIPPEAMEVPAENCLYWSSLHHKGIGSVVNNRLSHRRELRANTKPQAPVPAPLLDNPVTCPTCGTVCRSRAGRRLT